jgi:hypothetical protein
LIDAKRIIAKKMSAYSFLLACTVKFPNGTHNVIHLVDGTNIHVFLTLDNDWRDFFSESEEHRTLLISPQGKSEWALQSPVPNEGALDPAKFERWCKIGMGSFGSVYSGTYDGEPVAVKLLNPVFEQSEGTEKELRVLR